MDLPEICKYSRNFASFAKRKENRDSPKTCGITIQYVDLKVKNTNRIENEGDFAQNQGRGDTGTTDPPQQFWAAQRHWNNGWFANDSHGDKYKKRMQEEKHVSSSKGNVLFEYQ